MTMVFKTVSIFIIRDFCAWRSWW